MILSKYPAGCFDMRSFLCTGLKYSFFLATRPFKPNELRHLRTLFDDSFFTLIFLRWFAISLEDTLLSFSATFLTILAAQSFRDDCLTFQGKFPVIPKVLSFAAIFCTVETGKSNRFPIFLYPSPFLSNLITLSRSSLLYAFTFFHFRTGGGAFCSC